MSEDHQTAKSVSEPLSSEKENDSEKSFSSDASTSADHSEASENIAEGKAAVIGDSDITDEMTNEQDEREDSKNEIEDALPSKSENAEAPEDTSKQDNVVLPFDKTEALPHIEEDDVSREKTEPSISEPPKTVKASYSRDTKEHLIIGPEEIVLENSNAEIIINEDDLALIRQYMKLQQSSKK